MQKDCNFYFHQPYTIYYTYFYIIFKICAHRENYLLYLIQGIDIKPKDIVFIKKMFVILYNIGKISIYR